MSYNQNLKPAVMTLAFLSLTACGGGSSGGGGDDSGTGDTGPEFTDWTNLGSPGEVQNIWTSHAMEIDLDGNPVVARQDPDGNIHVQRWDDSASDWQPVGSLGVQGHRPELAIDSAGNPLIVYWAQPDGDDYSTAYASHWNGTSWDTLGATDELSDRSNAYNKAGNLADVEFDITGDPIVALPRVNNQLDEIIVRRWNGTNWEDVGATTQVNATEGTRYASLTVASAGNLLLAWAEMPQDVNGFETSEAAGYVAEFDSGTSSWSQLDQGNATPAEVNDVNNDGFAQIRNIYAMHETDDTPVVAWRYRAVFEVGSATYLRRLEGGTWSDHVADRLDDTIAPAAALDSSNRPLVAFSDLALDRKVTLSRWESSLWMALGDQLPGEAASLAITGDDTLYVGVQDKNSSPNELHIYRYSP